MIPDNNNLVMSHNNVTVENHKFTSWFGLKCIGYPPQDTLLNWTVTGNRTKMVRIDPNMATDDQFDHLNRTYELGIDLSLDNRSEYGDKDHEMAF